ncbi:hypothetical protein MMC17_004446 [Xylographa soralifera]|nr:hypothetical protein [Xylographa soralifera]
MEYTRLGKSGLKISKVILGAMSYGSSEWQDWVLNEEESLPLLEHAYKVGINTWDTADIYSNGRSEMVIAKAIEKYSIPRSKLVILSKCYFGFDPANPKVDMAAARTNDGKFVNQSGLSRKHIFDAVEASVKRLGTYIDVLQIHRLDRDTPREEIMKALNDVVEKGWVRYIGASSVSAYLSAMLITMLTGPQMAAWEFQQLQNVAKEHGWHQFVSMQNYYNLLYREEEREMIPYCRDAGVGLIPWSPVARGALARPWNNRDTLRNKTDAFLNVLVSRDNKVDEHIVNTLEEIAKSKGLPMATVATAWCLSKEAVNPIVGLNSKERIDQIVEAVKVKLTDEEIKRLEDGYLPKAIAAVY